MVPEIPITDNNECDDNTGYDFNPNYESDDMAMEKTVLSRSQKTFIMFNTLQQHN